MFLSRKQRDDVFFLETKRLYLRVVRPDAAMYVADYLSRNRAFHKPFHPYQSDDYFTRSEQREYILSDVYAYKKRERFPFWLSPKEQPERVIGRLSFSSIIGGAMSSCFVGYHMDVEETGKGYMKEALSYGCSFMFQNQHLHRIQADVMPHNTPSIRTVLSCGFKEQGLNEKYMCIDGVWQDHICFAKINENYW